MLNLKKIRLGIILGLILSVTMTVTAQADIIWEPTDSFYQQHRAACKEVYRSYIADGEDGYVAMYKSPASKEKVELYENGHEFNFSYSYTDNKGKEWGLVEPGVKTGWVPMEEVMLKYDNISFCVEYEEEFQEYNGEYDENLDNSTLILWVYPCSGQTIGKLPAISDVINIPYTYTDQNGNVWGLYGYAELIQRVKGKEDEASKWGGYGGWICLNDPDQVSFPVVDHQDDYIPAINELPSLEEVNSKSDMTFILIGALTLVIAVTAGILIRVKLKKGK